MFKKTVKSKSLPNAVICQFNFKHSVDILHRIEYSRRLSSSDGMWKFPVALIEALIFPFDFCSP